MAFFPGLHDPRQNAALDGRDQQPGLRALLSRPHQEAAQAARRPPLPRQGQLQRHPARLSAAAVSRCALRRPGARAALAHRVPDEAARAVLRGRPAASRSRCATCSGSGISSSASTGARSTPATPAAVERVLACWQGGAEVEGWARYWSHIYGHVADRLEAEPAACAPQRSSCASRSSAGSRRRRCAAVLEHCGLAAADDVLAGLASQLRFPTYYQPRFARRRAGADRSPHRRGRGRASATPPRPGDALSAPA